MSGSILNIGKSGLFAAQVGMSTTGHNIANANVAGYSRQLVIQASGPGQNIGAGFVGSGTKVTDIMRYSDPFLNGQVRSASTSKSALDTFHGQISQVDNLLADPTSGLSPALQDFFKGVQDVSSNPSSVASRQALISTAESLSARFQGINNRLEEIRSGVNSQVASNVTLINSYAGQIAQLNEQIGAVSSSGRQLPNDLMDKRDQLVLELSKQIKTNVLAADNNSITLTIGNGQPLVVGQKSFQLTTMTSPTDPTRVQVGYMAGGRVTPLADGQLSGGELGGLLEFRTSTLDRAQNALGRIAISIAQTFNDQHRLGLDQAGEPGENFFSEPKAEVSASRSNSLSSTAKVGAVVTDPSKLTQSDYKVTYNGGNYTVIRVSDNKQTVISPYPQTVPQSVDGIEFSIDNGLSAPGDNFLVRPTINGAALFSVAVTDSTKVAAAAPVTTATSVKNAGSARIGEGSVGAGYLAPGNALGAPLTLSYNAGSGGLTGFPAGQAVTRTVNGAPTVYPAGTASIPYVAGATYEFGGVSVDFSGAPVDGDTFTIAPNKNGVGDNRNMRLLGGLQTSNQVGGSATYQSAYAELVGYIGNKTREVQVKAEAGEGLLAQARAAQQNVSGVNLDEEATNLLKYQQAYQAAGKVMQIASTLFDTLLSLGR